MVGELAKKSIAYFGTGKFIIVLTEAHRHTQS
jgi:hypothetical protein